MDEGIHEAARTAGQLETPLQRDESRLRRLDGVLVELSMHRALIGGDLEAALRAITEAAARSLEVERARVWLYGPERSWRRCSDFYEKSADRHSQGAERRRAGFPDLEG
ncbi:MAG: hypothetical protein ACE5G2_10945, partial [Candidatus Krumholzibacteriia bacterium]